MNEYVNIGKIVATHGVNGAVIIKHNLAKKAAFKKGSIIFIEEVKGSYLPWFVETCKAPSAEECTLQLEGISSKEKAHRLLKKQVWLSENDFRQMAAKQAPASLLGYSIIHNGEQIGITEEVIEQPQQLLLKTTIQGKEVLIPIHESSLIKIDRKNKAVHVQLPDGLLEIYLNN